MRIVDRKTFLAMPDGTLFSKFEPNIFEDLQIKSGGPALHNDFFYTGIKDAIDNAGSSDFSDQLEKARTEEIPMDFDAIGRDGCFDDSDTFFAVWSATDVQKLIVRLTQALQTGYRDERGQYD
jgi:hypothetical protein